MKNKKVIYLIMVFFLFLNNDISLAQTTHFTTVQSTGLPYNIIITDALINDQTLESGDEIAVLDDTLVVGSAVYEGTFPLQITAWEGDPSQGLSGFIKGNLISFKIYDSSAQTEYDAESDYSTGNGNFGTGAYSAVSLSVTDTQSEAGHFTPVDPTGLPYNIIVTEANIESQPIVTGDEIGIFDGTTCVGSAIFAGTFPLQITTWESDPSQGLSGFTKNNTITFKIWDSSGEQEYTANASFSVGDGKFGTGAYSAVTLNVTIIQPSIGYFTPVDPTGLPYNIIITGATIDNFSIESGDEIGIFDGSLCVGSGIYIGTFPLQITAWEGDPSQGLTGFTKGNEISFVIWSSANETEYQAETSFSIGDGNFGYGAYSAAALLYLSQDISPPAIIGIPEAAGIDTSEATIIWKTDEPAISIVEYALEAEWPSGKIIVIDSNFVEEHELILSGLIPDSKYQFRVGSSDESGNGPTYSAEYTFSTLAVPDNLPPVLIGFPQFQNVDTSSTIIFWNTDELSTSIVEYGYDDIWPENKLIVTDTVLVKSHSIMLINLSPGTKYRYIVGSTDGKGNGPAYSKEFTFTTIEVPDIIPPIIKGFPEVGGIDTNSAYIKWKTDELANSIVEIAPENQWPNNVITVSDQDLVKEHYLFIKDLTPNTSYKFRVSSIDAAGNGPSYSNIFSFKTLEIPDTKPPVIIGFPLVTDFDTTSVTVEWKTNEISTSIIEYAPESIWPSGKKEIIYNDLVTCHKINISNLTPATKYRFRVGSTDSKGNGPVYSDEYDFKTSALPDITPPNILGLPYFSELGTNSVVIKWITDENSTSIVEYAIDSIWGDTKTEIIDNELVNEHSVYISNLNSSTTYIYKVGSVDAKNNGPAYSDKYSFTTLDLPDTIAPVILGIPSETGIDTSSVTIEWKTDEASNSIVQIAIDSLWPDNLTEITEQALVEDHFIYISYLNPNTKYSYLVGSLDAEGNGPTYSEVFSFKTKDLPDTKAPEVIDAVRVIGLSHHQATIKWKTNEKAYSSVDYDTTIELRFMVSESKGKTTHNIKLTNLSASTKYYFRIHSKDQNGNEYIGDTLDFTTHSHPVVADTSTPVIVEGPIEKDVKSDKATIKWRTDKSSSSTVEYGLKDNKLNSKKVIDASIGVNEHIVNLTKLKRDTTYYYRVRSIGSNNREVISDIFNFNTEAVPDTLAPVILTGPIVSFLEFNKAVIEWKTDKLSSSIINYGKDDSYGFTEKYDMLQGVIEHKVTLTGLESETEYHFNVESKSENLENVISDDFAFITTAAVDTMAPKIISGPAATSIDHNKTTIEWETDELSDSYIEYDTTEALLNYEYSDKDASGVLKHKMVLTNLLPGTKYKYRVFSSDWSPNRNIISNIIKTFQTAATFDTIPPNLIRDPVVTVTENTATFEWETDELSDTYVYYREKGFSKKYKKSGNEKKVLVHLFTVANLKKKTEYEFVLTSRDLSGNIMTWPETGEIEKIEKILEIRSTMQPPGGDGTFVTNENPDTQSPIFLSGPTVTAKSNNLVTIEWQTDERSDSYIEYGKTKDYGKYKAEAEDVFDHKITLTNLDPGTLYNFKVRSVDLSNNAPTESENSVFLTESEVDLTPPRIIEGPYVEYITNNLATIIWKTDEAGDTKVDYGTDENYGTTKNIAEMVTNHRVTLTNLTPNTVYHFKVYSSDVENNGPTPSENQIIQTESSPDLISPIISNVEITAKTNHTATVEWDTDELSNSFIDYGFSTIFNLKAGNSDYVKHHKVILTGLLADTLYYFKVGSIDISNNESVSLSDTTFRTETAADTISPLIPTGFEAIAGSEKILLRWNENLEGDLAGYNVYRKIESAFVPIATNVTDTFYYDTGLENDMEYEYQIKALDNISPPNTSDASSIVTAVPALGNILTVPVLSYPSPGMGVCTKNTTLQIVNSTKPEQSQKLTYSFLVATDSNFYQVLLFEEGIEEDTSGFTNWTISQELEHGKIYYWKARAFDGYFYSPWMGKSSFSADETIPTGIKLVNFFGKDNSGKVELEWEIANYNDVKGFNLFKSTNNDREFRRFNEEILIGYKGKFYLSDINVEVGKTYYYSLEAITKHNHNEYSNETISVYVKPPNSFKLGQNYPNPFNAITTIKYELPVRAKVQLTIFNILGQEVKTLLNEQKDPGFHKIYWDGKNNLGIPVASSMYIYQIKAGNFIDTKKMVLLK